MMKRLNRRHFMEKSLIFSGALAASFTFEHQPLLAQLKGQTKPSPTKVPADPPPMGKIGKLKISRLICGGNLFSGFAHSGNLAYVSRLLKHYFVDEKVLDTLQLCEESGINTAILRTDDHIVNILRRYRRERGGKIQWIAQTYPTVDNLTENIKMAIDNGAVGAFVMGGNAETFFKEGRMDSTGEVVSFMKQNGLVAGVGSHTLAVANAVEQQKVDPDFYFKTINAVRYESEDPDEIATFMKTIKKPWIAFKALGAGRMNPREGFDLAFKMGADFVNAGMFDFQVVEDVSLVRGIVSNHAKRDRAWGG